MELSSIEPRGEARKVVRSGRGSLERVGDVHVLRVAGDQRLKSLIDDVYAAKGAVVEVKPLRTGLEDVFVDAVGAASRAGSAAVVHPEPEPELSRR